VYEYSLRIGLTNIKRCVGDRFGKNDIQYEREKKRFEVFYKGIN
jgi:hypothetical protein